MVFYLCYVCSVAVKTFAPWRITTKKRIQLNYYVNDYYNFHFFWKFQFFLSSLLFVLNTFWIVCQWSWSFEWIKNIHSISVFFPFSHNPIIRHFAILKTIKRNVHVWNVCVDMPLLASLFLPKGKIENRFQYGLHEPVYDFQDVKWIKVFVFFWISFLI